MIRVEYLWEPTQCAHCLVFGHKTGSCTKAVLYNKSTPTVANVDSDGFTKVVRKHWRPKERKQGVDIGESSGVNPSNDMGQTQTPSNDNPTTTPTTVTADKETDGMVADGTTGMDGVKSGSQQNNPLTDSEQDIPVVAKVLKTYRTTPKPLKSILKTYNRYSTLGKAETVESSQVSIQQIEQADREGHRRIGEPVMTLDGNSSPSSSRND